MRLLVVEDNLDIQANIAEFLESDYQLDFAYTGSQGLELALAHHYDVIILDVMLPHRDGISVCAAYRQAASVQAPILMLTARDTLDDKEAGFAAGADDYLIKPFALRELKMRVDALAKRGKFRDPTHPSYDDVELDLELGEIRSSEGAATLGKMEMRLAALLVHAAPGTVSSETIVNRLWGDDEPASAALRTHVYHLRRRLASLGSLCEIVAVRGRGYRLSSARADD